MFNPAHPGELIRELCIDPLNLTVTNSAKALGVSRKALSELLNGHSRITPEMAVRLSIAFNTSAESWINQQAKYDLWLVEQKRDQFNVQVLVHSNAA